MLPCRAVGAACSFFVVAVGETEGDCERHTEGVEGTGDGRRISEGYAWDPVCRMGELLWELSVVTTVGGPNATMVVL